MDSPEEDSDQDWSQAWDKDLLTESEVSRNGPTVVDQHISGPSQQNGSRYFENEVKKEEQVNRKIEEQMRKIPKLTEATIQQGVVIADKLLADLESSRDLSRTIVHIDMDAFFAAVEMRENPKLKNIPMAVGGNDMLSTSNYLARRFGVRAAMPGFIAKKLCPGLVIVPASYDKYQAVSKDVRAILSQYDPNMCPMSLDEAYLDITEHLEKRKQFTEEQRTYRRTLTEEEVCTCGADDVGKIPASQMDETTECENISFDSEDREIVTIRCATCSKQKCLGDEVTTFGISAEEAVREMRFRIHTATMITASAGIAPNMLLAKVCSDKNKPNGQFVIPSTRQAIFEFVRDLPIRKVFGIGKVSEKMLTAVGVTTCTDLYNKRGLLYHLYSTISFNYFMRVCIGIGSTRVERDYERKSIGVERTFSEISKPAELYKKCYELSEALTEDLSKEQMLGKTVTLKLKLSNFEMRTRSHTQIQYISDMESIYDAAKAILRQEIQGASPAPLKLRLMGVRMTNLISEGEVTKQKTISGLFKKITTKTQSDVDHSLPVISQLESVNSGHIPEQSNDNERFSVTIDNCHRDQFKTVESSMDIDPRKNFCTPAREPNNEGNVIPGSSPKIVEQFDTVYSTDNSLPECFGEKNGQQLECRSVSMASDDGLEANLGRDDTNKESRSSLFGYVSHVKTDQDQLNKSVFWKDCMTDSQLGGHCVPKLNDVMEGVFCGKERGDTECSENDKSDTELDEHQDYTASVEKSFQITKERNVNNSSPIGSRFLKPDVTKSEQVSQSRDLCDMDSMCVDKVKGLAESCETYCCTQVEDCQKYECPVCCKNLYFRNLNLFTEHIDECLARKCVTDEDRALKLESPNNQKILNSGSGLDKHGSVRANDVSEKYAQQHAEESELSAPSTSTNSQDILICPVCNAPQRKSNMVLFNQHVDACLNRQTIKEIVQEDRPTGKRLSSGHGIQTPSKKQKTVHKASSNTLSNMTILGFFKGKN
ncbi:hypothetical protein LSH36_368g00004 [Paralvinella palmiformis]|uniref:DNA polymerase kappa n=1 Tax=Paralvinella palmiformis TaxID=53620 RepID=A0AAD9JER5_9ANNE|nr:hypothetical protein LSH36_368g00004 [Paralvinella palmiformis]